MTTPQEAAEPNVGQVRTSWLTLRYPGLVGALIVFLLALTPSLLPRPWLYEALVAGVGAAVGYGLGVLVWWAIRRMWKPTISPTVARWGWRGLAVAGPLLIIGGLILGRRWQNEVRELVGEPQSTAGHFLLIALVSVVLLAIILLISRGIRAFNRAIARLLGRVIPLAVAQTIAVVVVAFTLYWVLTGVAFDAAVKFADKTYSSQNEGTPDGVTPTTSQLRSGGPGSLVSWDSLGYQGRGFIGGGPTASDITEFTGDPAEHPIRVYAGLESADTADERAALAVQGTGTNRCFRSPGPDRGRRYRHWMA